MKILLDNKLNKHDKPGFLGEDTTQEVDSNGNPLTPEQVKFFANSNNINEDIWNKAGTIYQPKQDSRYKRLIRKPINTLTQEEIKYIFTIHWCWYLANVRRFDYIEDALENTDDRFREEYFNECYEFFHSMSFPLKVYRAIRDSEHSNDEFTINGKNSSYSWSTNINIYKDVTSKFRNCTKIVSCEIDSNVIDVANTINNFIFYTSSHHDRGYGEYEITLKQHFPQSALKNLHWIDKNEINEKLLSESLHKLGSNCFITDSPYDIKNLIMNKPKLYRILYDANIDMYMIGDGNEIIHWDMIREAERQGYYANQEEFIEELGGALDNYVETGMYGLYDDDYEIDPYLLYMIFSPDGKEFMLGEDGYDGVSRFGFGSMFFRDADQGLMDNCDLIRILQKQSWANESMELNESPQEVDIEKVVDDIIKELDSLTTEKVLSILNTSTRNDIDTSSSMFILPNGEILSVANALTTNGIDDMFDDIHDSLGYVIVYNLTKQMNVEESFMDILDDTYIDRKLDSIMSILTYDLGWARINCGTTLKEDRFYCVLPNHMKYTQYHTLQNWLEWGYDTGKQKVLVFVSSYEDGNWYSFKDNFPEDIIKKIKRYYSSGRLYENRSEMKEDMNDNDMNIHPQVEMQLNYLRRNAEDKYNKGSRREYENIYNYKEYQKEVDRDGDKNLLVMGRLKDPYQFRDMFGVKPFARRYKNSDLLVYRTARGSEILVNIEEIDVVNKNRNGINEDFVNKLVPGELYHFIHNDKILYGTFKRKTPGWLFFDVEGKEVLAKPWTSVATTTEELEELIGLVDKMEKDTKVPSQVLNRFTRVPNQHGKPMGESNELEQRAKKHKKKSKGMGWHMSMNAGDVEKGIEVFNNSTSLGSGEGAPMGESVAQNVYHYDGPIYYRGHKIAEKSNINTTAKSINIAIRNILYKAARGDEELYNYDIVDDMVRPVEDDYDLKPERPRCHTCGYELNDIGDCPVCDYGEDDLLESLTDLEALWKLSTLD